MPMKKAVLAALLFLVLFTSTGCGGKTYPFRQSVDEIESVEIVSAEDAFAFTVVKTLSEAETQEFLKQFQTMLFYRYLGDPRTLYGDSIRIVYSNGNYEMICKHTAEYVENGRRLYRWTSCYEDEFNELINSFLKQA